MALINVMGYPVLIQLEHNGTPIGTGDEGQDIFEIRTVHWQELAGQSWAIHAQSNVFPPVDVVIAANESGFRNLPGPQRFPSWPLRTDITVS